MSTQQKLSIVKHEKPIVCPDCQSKLSHSITSNTAVPTDEKPIIGICHWCGAVLLVLSNNKVKLPSQDDLRKMFPTNQVFLRFILEAASMELHLRLHKTVREDQERQKLANN